MQNKFVIKFSNKVIQFIGQKTYRNEQSWLHWLFLCAYSKCMIPIIKNHLSLILLLSFKISVFDDILETFWFDIAV